MQRDLSRWVLAESYRMPRFQSTGFNSQLCSPGSHIQGYMYLQYFVKIYVALDNFAKQAFKEQKDYLLLKRTIFIRRKMQYCPLRWGKRISLKV